MKKIWIDMSHYNKTSWYGVVTKNIIDELLQYEDFDFFLFSNEEISLPEHIKRRNIHIIISKWINYMYYRMRYQAKILKENKIDVFYTCDQIVPLRKVCIYISTIHDIFLWLSFLWFKSFAMPKTRSYKKRFPYYLLGMDKRFAKRSDYIISPSEYTRQDVVKNLWIKKEKIIVAHRGIDHIKKCEQVVKQEYILFPLCTIFHDNFIFNLWERILALNMSAKIIYWKPWSLFCEMTYENTNPKIEILQKWISDEEKEKLISSAKLAIYISPFEWFWFVPLECLRLWTPLIYNNVWSLGEVIGDSAIGIDSLDIERYIQWINKINNNLEGFIQKWLAKSDRYVRKETVGKIISKF